MKLLNYSSKIKKLIKTTSFKNIKNKKTNYHFPLLEDGFIDEDIFKA